MTSKKDKAVHFSNFLSQIPEQVYEEIFQEIVADANITIERIISHGHSSPETGWYDQEKSEWVMVIEGEAIIEFENEKEITLKQNDFLLIKPHQKHRVKWTSPDQKTVWLAIHF